MADWGKIKREYVTGDISYGALAKKYHIAKSQIGHRILASCSRRSISALMPLMSRRSLRAATRARSYGGARGGGKSFFVRWKAIRL